jgi:hypothetical protein
LQLELDEDGNPIKKKRKKAAATKKKVSADTRLWYAGTMQL